MTAAVLIKNGRGFINLGHWTVGGGVGGVGLDIGTGASSVVLIAQVIWAIVKHISTLEVYVKWLLIIATKSLECINLVQSVAGLATTSLGTKQNNIMNNHE